MLHTQLIRSRRQALKLTQKEVADASDLYLTQLCNIEKNIVSLPISKMIAVERTLKLKDGELFEAYMKDTRIKFLKRLK